MDIPQSNSLAGGAPEGGAEDDVDLVHVDEHVVVLRAELPDQLVEADEVANFRENVGERPRTDLSRRCAPPQGQTSGLVVFFTQTVDGDVGW